MLPALTWFHRWLGIATCLVFAMWFASGAVMLFVPFPSASAADRVASAAPIDWARVRVSPAQALAAAGVGEGDVRLIQRGGAPAYIVQGAGTTTAVSAEAGTPLRLLPPGRIGATGPAIDYDQWIVANGIDPYRPVYRMPRNDAAGTVDYLSAVTGELVQRTTARARAWNWVGSVLHWIYFTPLRSNWAAWDQVVWWLSLAALLMALAGAVLGVARTVTAARARRGSLTYFRARWMRWHHLLGLFVGVFVVTWIFSGWLSMDHGRLFSRGEATLAQHAAFAGRSSISAVSPEVLRALGPASQVAITRLGGAPILAVTRPDGSAERLDVTGRRLEDRQFAALLATAATAAWPGTRVASVEAVPPDDILALNEGWPETVRRVRLAPPARQALYVDGANGRLLTVMDASRRNYAWVYYALHTFKFPGLVGYPELRKAIVLLLMLVGFAFSLTGVAIGWQRLRRL